MACDNNLSLFKTVDATGNSFVKTKLALWRLKVLTVQKGKTVRTFVLMMHSMHNAIHTSFLT